jgi:hypothetical protein
MMSIASSTKNVVPSMQLEKYASKNAKLAKIHSPKAPHFFWRNAGLDFTHHFFTLPDPYGNDFVLGTFSFRITDIRGNHIHHNFRKVKGTA